MRNRWHLQGDIYDCVIEIIRRSPQAITSSIVYDIRVNKNSI